MSRGPCPSADDLAVYALGALGDGEWEPVEVHALQCAGCRRALAELQLAVDLLAVGVPAHEPSPQLAARVMSVARSEADLLRAGGAQADRPVRRRLLSLRPVPALAAACVLVAFGLGTGLLVLDDGGSSSRSIAALVDATSAPGAHAVLHVRRDGGRLVVTHLPAPPPGRIYEVWLDRSDDRLPPEPTSALFSVDRHGSASVDVPGSLRHVDAVLVTAEPDGGSTVPSESPVIRVRLT